MALFLRNTCRLAAPIKRIKPNDFLNLKHAFTNSNGALSFRPISSRISKCEIYRVSSFQCRTFKVVSRRNRNDETKIRNVKPADETKPEVDPAGPGTGAEKPQDVKPEAQKPGVVARFKQMYRDYWYVLVPVHIVTSIGWLGGFYYMAKSGVDVIALLKSIGVSDRFTDPLKDSSMGYVALAYALYKIATPLRYTVTLGGTTISIKYLQQWGYIKPMPSTEKLKEMYQVKKEGIQDMYTEKKLELKHRKQQFTDRRDHVMGDIAKYRKEMAKFRRDEKMQRQNIKHRKR